MVRHRKSGGQGHRHHMGNRLPMPLSSRNSDVRRGISFRLPAAKLSHLLESYFWPIHGYIWYDVRPRDLSIFRDPSEFLVLCSHRVQLVNDSSSGEPNYVNDPPGPGPSEVGLRELEPRRQVPTLAAGFDHRRDHRRDVAARRCPPLTERKEQR